MDTKEMNVRLLRIVENQKDITMLMTENQKILLSMIPGFDTIIEKPKKPIFVSHVSTFVDEEIKGSSSAVLEFERGELFEKYSMWCKQKSIQQLSKKNFLEEVRKENVFTERRTGSYFRFYYSASLANIPDDLPF